MSAEADTTVHAHLVVILNERVLSAAKSGDIPKLQVLRCVLGPIRALTAKWPTLAAGAAATWRRCRASRPVRLDRSAGAQGSRLRRTFRGCNLRPYLFHWPTRIRLPMWAALFAQTTRTGQDCQ
jgi:hypothetical protein